MTKNAMNIHKTTAANSTYPKVAVQWLNQALCFYQSLCLVDSAVLRNRLLRLAANRYRIQYFRNLNLNWESSEKSLFITRKYLMH